MQSRLERRVQDSVDALDYDDGELEVDSDFYSVTRDIYLSLYDSGMYFCMEKSRRDLISSQSWRTELPVR